MEIIGEGNLRKKIVNNEATILTLERERLIKNFSENNIEAYANFLEPFFRTRIEQILTPDNILSKTKESFIENPFVIDNFNYLEQKVIDHAYILNSNKSIYAKFVDELVYDSVIRYLLIDLSKDVERNNFDKLLKFLIKKFKNELEQYFPLFMAGLKALVENEKKIKDKPYLFKIKKDFADSESPVLLFYGTNISGKNYPITVVTAEPKKTIEDRCDFYIVAVAQNPDKTKKLRMGAILIINSSDVVLIPAEYFFKKNLSSSSYEFINNI